MTSVFSEYHRCRRSSSSSIELLFSRISTGLGKNTCQSCASWNFENFQFTIEIFQVRFSKISLLFQISRLLWHAIAVLKSWFSFNLYIQFNLQDRYPSSHSKETNSLKQAAYFLITQIEAGKVSVDMSQYTGVSSRFTVKSVHFDEV